MCALSDEKEVCPLEHIAPFQTGKPDFQSIEGSQLITVGGQNFLCLTLVEGGQNLTVGSLGEDKSWMDTYHLQRMKPASIDKNIFLDAENL